MRFNLVIADSDCWYSDALCRYIRGAYASKFNINVFTCSESLAQYLKDNAGKTDILLTAPELLNSCEINQARPGIVIVLDSGKVEHEETEYPYINKYRSGESIIRDVIELFSSQNSNVKQVLKENRRTSFIMVYSPAGGSGKTFLSASLTASLARAGLRVLYLNLESANSSRLFTGISQSNCGLSKLIFHLKQNSKNLLVRLESAKSFSKQLGAFYFAAADCSLEIDELTGDDILRLLYGIRELGQFDVVVIDSDSAISGRSAALLNSSDLILLVTLQDILVNHKTEAFLREIEKVFPENFSEILGKVSTVMNRYDPDITAVDAVVWGKPAAYRIPYIRDVFRYHSGNPVFNADSVLETSINDIRKDIISNTL